MNAIAFLAAACLLLAACDPAQVADKVGRRAAESVVLPVVSNYFTAPQAQTATLCVVENATANEIQLLARDVAVQAGTSTVQTILAIGARPETLACLSRAGLPPLGL